MSKKNPTLTPEICQRVVESISQVLQSKYLFPETAQKMAASLKAASYDSFQSPGKLAQQLTADLREISHDGHLHVIHSPAEFVRLKDSMPAKGEVNDAYEDEWWSYVHSDNFGIPELAYLTGSIGYLKITHFAPASLAGEVVVTAMQFLARASALIFDLRVCNGGDPYTVQLFETFLFSRRKRPHLLITQYENRGEDIHQIWTLPFVPGERLPDVPVYVLTSSRTFSGGEDMAYTLKHHGRALIVGETTGGGAHGIEPLPLCDGFFALIPTSYPLHPVTRKNWEGTGVAPDIETPQEQALEKAHLHALENLASACEDPHEKHALAWCLAQAKADYAPCPTDPEQLAAYAGTYQNYQIHFENGQLFLSEQAKAYRWRMHPIDTLTFTGDEDYHIRFEVDEDGTVTGLTWLAREDDREFTYEKTA